MKSGSRIALLVAIVAATLFVVPNAGADRVYHSQHVALTSVAGAPLRAGFVENIHANGPNVFAHEVYVLIGAAPETSYAVHVIAYPFDPTCSGTGVDLGATTLTTNVAGNGRADRFIRPSDVPSAVRGTTLGVRWEVTRDGTVVYTSTCQAVTLD